MPGFGAALTTGSIGHPESGLHDLTTDEASDILATLHRKYEYCYSVYEELSVQLSELIDRASSQQPLSSTDNQSAYIPSGCRLPPCDTEVFEGDYLKWPTFRDLFTAVYVNNTRLTPVEKLFHLNAKTSELQSTIQGCLTALAHSKISTENWDCLLVYLCASKLPRLTLSLWEQSLTSKSDVPTWDEMNAFLSDRYRTLEAIEDMKQSLGGPSTSKNSQVTKKLNSFEAKVSVKPKSCDLCSKETHPVRLCPRFIQMAVEARENYIKKKQLCLNCFARGHQLRDCSSTHSCFVCRGRHHTLLHRGNPFSNNPSSSGHARPRSDPPSGGSDIPDEHSNVQVCFASGSKAVLLGTAMIDICHLGTHFRARALIDSGSEATFITERLFKLVNLPFRPIQAQVSGLNQTVAAQSTRLCHFAIRSPTKPGLQLDTAAYVLPELAGRLPSHSIPQDILRDLPNLQWADPTFLQSSQIDVLIGADILPSVLLSGTKTNICGSLFGQETIFGWVLTGPVSMSTSNRVSAFTTQITKTSEASLDKLLTKFWEVEDLPSKMVKESDSVCESHMREVSPTHNSPNYYLPHHAVIKPESTTTKLRVVFNASSPSANGTSLNDVLHAGPVLQSDLTIQILKWRYFKYVFSADITKMYRQIWVDPKHTPFQRILFRNKEGDIRDYELKTVTFGVNCAPYLAIRVLKQLADDVDQQFPKASHIIRNFMYVDDVLAGSNSQQEAQLAIQELVTALNSAGFPLRKWTSNHKGVLKDIPNEHLLHSEFLNIDAESTAKTLGIRWRATTDEFYFVPPEISVKSSYTKREVLSQITKLFDPAGWLAPFIVRAKIFMQEIWLQELGWDDNLPDEMSHRWQVFLQSYSDLDQIRIPRWVGYQPQVKIELHGFCDASQKAYGAALYVRVEVGQQILTNLLTAKTRVAPVKTVSLPRLELCGALLLADMASTILPNMLSKSSEIFCWTDSTIVLAWLKKPACSWTTFVANRVTKIAQATKIENWSHVRSEHNPADLASRGVSLQELGDSNLWWHGPQWLQLPKLQWPETSDPHPVTELEQRAVKVHFVKLPADDFLDRFSRLDKALRVLAYFQRFLNRCRKAPVSPDKQLSNREIREAERTYIILAQREEYALELRLLRSKRSIPASSPIANLFPFIDQQGLLRACGRLTASKVLQYDERHPVLLPYSCRLSRLLVQFMHQITLHGGNQLIVRLMRSKYWIPKVKNLVKGVVNSCKVCTIYKKRLQTQLMGDFPTDRASFSRPFTYTGVDYAGPFEAIHLEPTSDLTTEKFLAAFARFLARRGCSQRVHSDNGKTFVGASSLISRDFTQALKRAPHKGGLWEAGVKSFKTLFYKSTSARKYTFEELSTLLAKIEACLNSRPLSPMSEDPTDLLALTPGHFLIGGPLLSTAEPEIKGEAQSIINRWQHLKAQHQQFSSRWKEEYLKELHKRNKWLSPSRNLQVDDMVVIKDDNLPSNDWRLGRIVAAIPGADTRVRVVDILTSRGTIQRPVHKLVLLPMEDKAISALPQ
ncbi:uncharacterized protein [Drosophila takahashii]|uniref:uncharacterized protein n=1 Tax=Drosophila takahashii TaxID=29030 RepID=UPI0038995618